MEPSIEKPSRLHQTKSCLYWIKKFGSTTTYLNLESLNVLITFPPFHGIDSSSSRQGHYVLCCISLMKEWPTVDWFDGKWMYRFIQLIFLDRDLFVGGPTTYTCTLYAKMRRGIVRGLYQIFVEALHSIVMFSFLLECALNYCFLFLFLNGWLLIFLLLILTPISFSWAFFIHQKVERISMWGIPHTVLGTEHANLF